MPRFKRVVASTRRDKVLEPGREADPEVRPIAQLTAMSAAGLAMAAMVAAALQTLRAEIPTVHSANLLPPAVAAEEFAVLQAEGPFSSPF